MKYTLLFFKFILTLTLALTLYLSGCDNKSDDNSSKKTDEKSNISNESKSGSGTETKNESVSAQDEELKKKEEANKEITQENENKANELGMTPGLPKNFPADLPQPKNSKTLGSINSTDGTIVTFESGDKVLDIVNYYKEEMKKGGYTLTETGETLVSDKGGLINWTKDKKEVGLTLGYDKDRNVTSIALTYK